MMILRRTGALLVVSLIAIPGSLRVYSQSPQNFPDVAAFRERVRAAIRLDYELQKQFTYTEQRRDVKISALGKVEVGPERTFEVYPSQIPGRTYKRLIAIDGRPLSEAELASREREHQKNQAARTARLENETAEERAERLQEELEDRREREAIVRDGFAVFETTFIGREVLEGQPVLIVALTPRQDARVSTREGKWMKKFEGHAWVAEDDYQVARLEMRARDDVSIGWGILGRVHEGSRFVFTRRKFEGTWLPAQVIFDATGRTLLFRKFDLDLVTTFSRYKRIS